MPTTGPNLGIQHSWASRESGWNTGMDANLKKLDALVMGQVKDKDLATPPGSPANGDRYIVASSPTGAWAGHTGELAVYEVSAWAFYAPKNGFVVWVDDEDRLYVYNASAWQKYEPGVATGTGKRLWLPASIFGYNAMARYTPLDEGAYEYINLPAAGDTDLHTWWKVPDDFGALAGFDLYMVAMGTSTTTLTMAFTYILAAAHDAFADNLVTYATLSLAVAPTSSGRMVIKSGITLPTGPPTLTAGSLAKMVLRRYNAFDANNDDYRFLGMMLRYTTQ